MLLGFDQHPRQARIDGHAGHDPPPVRQSVTLETLAVRMGIVLLDGFQLNQKAETVTNAAGVGTVDKREGADIAQFQADHAQDDLGQVGPQDLRRRKPRTALVAFLVEEPDTDAVFHPSAASHALVGTAAGDGADRQGRGARARRITGNPRQAGVHHVADTRNRDRGFSHVGGHDDLARPCAGKHTTLVRGRQTGVEGHDHRLGIAASGQQFTGLANVLLGGHEDENIPTGAFPHQIIDGGNGGLDIGDVVAFGVVVFDRPIAHLDGKHAARDLDDGGVVEGLRKFLGIDGGRGDNEFQITAPLHQFFQDAQQEIDIQAALVRFVHDQGVISGQGGIALGFRQQDAVGHDFDKTVLVAAVLKTDLVAHRVPQRLTKFIGNPLGHRGRRNAPGLGAANQTALTAPGRQAELGQLRGLARTGLTGYDHHRVLLYRCYDFGLPGRDRQRFKWFP